MRRERHSGVRYTSGQGTGLSQEPRRTTPFCRATSRPQDQSHWITIKQEKRDVDCWISWKEKAHMWSSQSLSAPESSNNVRRIIAGMRENQRSPTLGCSVFTLWVAEISNLNVNPSQWESGASHFLCTTTGAKKEPIIAPRETLKRIQPKWYEVENFSAFVINTLTENPTDHKDAEVCSGVCRRTVTSLVGVVTGAPCHMTQNIVGTRRLQSDGAADDRTLIG